MYGKSSMNKLSPITPIIDDDSLKGRNCTEEENMDIHNDDNDDNNTPIMVNLNEDDFQQAKNNNDSSNCDESESNTDVIEFVNDSDASDICGINEKSFMFINPGVENNDDSNVDIYALSSVNSSDSSSAVAETD
jgi:hypothetical protein